MNENDVCTSSECQHRFDCKSHIRNAIEFREPETFTYVDMSKGKSINICAYYESADKPGGGEYI